MQDSTVCTEQIRESSQQSRADILDLARQLERLGHGAEQFLIRQFEQLEQAIDEFEQEKAAWRRQLRRETAQLARERADIERLKDSASSPHPGSADKGQSDAQIKQEAARRTARKTADAPIRLLLQPHKASPMQVGLLLFEISKLNRDMGGHGLRFEVTDARQPVRKLLERTSGVTCRGEILEITGFSSLPLAARGRHVELDVDITERLENWIAFKSRLIQTALVNKDLAAAFDRGKPADHRKNGAGIIRIASQRVDDAMSLDYDQNAYTGGPLFVSSSLDAIRQQIDRLDGCLERLGQDSGLQAHISLPHALRSNSG